MILVATLLVYCTAAASFLSYPTGRHLNAGQYVFGNADSSLLETLRLSDRSLFLFLSPAPVTNTLIRHQHGDPHYISASSLMDADGDLRAEGSPIITFTTLEGRVANPTLLLLPQALQLV